MPARTRLAPHVAVVLLALAGCSETRTPGPPAQEPATVNPPGTAVAAAKPATPVTSPRPTECTHKGSGKDYAVGPGKEFDAIGKVPFERLKPGDTVRIHWRPEPYREKLMISGYGTAAQPIRVCGVAGPKGELPVIDGKDATTRSELIFPFDGHQVRALVIIGHQGTRPYHDQPKHIVLEGLALRNASPPYKFTDKAGKVLEYTSNAAGVFVQRADNVTIRGCDISENNGGIFAGSSGGPQLTHDVLIEGNYIHDNGSVTDYYSHNVYNESWNVIHQFNHYGPPRAGARGILGANIKERSSGVVIRYNWIEDGAHLIDLVDAQEARDDSVPAPTFHETYIYGNLLLRGKTNSGSMVHYGGDSGLRDTYRKGTLHFFQNTVVVKNDAYADYDRPAVFEISTNDEKLVARNNVFFSTSAPRVRAPVLMLGARDEVANGVATFAGNWVTTGWSPFDQIPGNRTKVNAQVQGFESSTFGTAPGFKNLGADDYTLSADAAVRAKGATLRGQVPDGHLPQSQYVRHQNGKPRTDIAAPSIGAFTD